MLPSLEIYLLFGCIDALVQRSYSPFPEWLRKRGASTCWYLEAIRHLYEQYEGEAVVGAGLRKAFRNLPAATVACVGW